MASTCLETNLYLNLNNLCRTCSKVTTTNHYHLYQDIPVDRGPKKSYLKLINELLNVNISLEEDAVEPKKLCKKCVTLLKTIYIFILEARRLHEEYTKVHKSSIEGGIIKTEDCLREPSIDIKQQPDEVLEIKLEDSCPLKSSSLEYIELDKIQNQITDGTIKQEPNTSNAEITVEDEYLKNVTNVLDFDSLDNLENLDNSDNLGELCNKDAITGDNARNKCSYKSNCSDESSDHDVAVRCDVCHKIYKNKKVLNKHKYYTHMTDEEKLPCTLCEFKTSRIDSLKVHMRKRHGPDTVEKYIKPKYKPVPKFSCNRCPKKYCRKDDLKRHIKKNHSNATNLPQKTKVQKPEKPEKPKDLNLCDFCGKSFTTIESLRMHARKHTGERPYKCDLCDKAFRRHQDMKLHRVIHSDDKPHQCNECGKSFKRPDKLRTHMRVHSELRPYKCNECAKTFKYSSVLKTHMYIHTGQKPFECKTCNENFSLRTTLNAHCLKYNHVKN